MTLALIITYVFVACIWWGAHHAIAPTHAELMVFSGVFWPFAIVGFGAFFATRLAMKYVTAFLKELNEHEAKP